MRVGGAWAAMAIVLASGLGGCGGNPNAVKRFSPRAMPLARMLQKAVDIHSTGEAAGVLHEAERMYFSGQIDSADYETIRRIEGDLRGNNRNSAVRVFETAIGKRASAEETEEEKAVEKKKADDEIAASKAAELKKNQGKAASKALDDLLGNDPLPAPLERK